MHAIACKMVSEYYLITDLISIIFADWQWLCGASYYPWLPKNTQNAESSIAVGTSLPRNWQSVSFTRISEAHRPVFGQVTSRPRANKCQSRSTRKVRLVTTSKRVTRSTEFRTETIHFRKSKTKTLAAQPSKAKTVASPESLLHRASRRSLNDAQNGNRSDQNLDG